MYLERVNFRVSERKSMSMLCILRSILQQKTQPIGYEIKIQMYMVYTCILGNKSIDFTSAQNATYISNTSNYNSNISEINWELGHVKIKPKKQNIKATTCSTLKQSKDNSEKLCQVE